MITHVLDTNVVSALMTGDAAVALRLAALAPTAVAIPQPVLAELAYGVERLPRSKRRESLASALERVRGTIQRAYWTDDVSAQFARIKTILERSGRRIEDFDVAIAAHAVALDAALVTANVEHMGRVAGLRVEDWSS